VTHRVLLLVALALGGAVAARAQEPALVLGAGLFGLDGNEDQAAVLDGEYRWAPWAVTGVLKIHPLVGVLGTSHATFHVRAGLGRDFPFAQRWNVNINSGPGYYHTGNGKELGSDIEFRSAIELSCRLNAHQRLGVSLAHLSNAGIAEHNPGIESFEVVFAWLDPFRGAR
jgi:hypothetical protein